MSKRDAVHNYNGQCKCGTRVVKQIVATTVPGSIPVEMWMCPNCDFNKG